MIIDHDKKNRIWYIIFRQCDDYCASDYGKIHIFRNMYTEKISKIMIM